MKTKARDSIRLPDGSVMTLQEALDRGLVTLIASNYYDPPRYFARAGDVSWEVGKTLYLSRVGGKLPFGAAVAPQPARVLIFVLPGCEACEEWKPILDDLASKVAPAVETSYLDGDTDLAYEKFRVTDVPAVFAVSPDGKVIGRAIGLRSERQARRLFGRALRSAKR